MFHALQVQSQRWYDEALYSRDLTDPDDPDNSDTIVSIEVKTLDDLYDLLTLARGVTHRSGLMVFCSVETANGINAESFIGQGWAMPADIAGGEIHVRQTVQDDKKTHAIKEAVGILNAAVAP